MVKLTFPRELKLLTPSCFNYVFENPVRTSTAQLTILGRENNINHPRLGLVIAKKQIKKAHDRNRIKRLIRENFRSNQHLLPAMDFIVIAKKGITELDNNTITKVLDKLWQRHCRRQHAL